MTKDDFLAKADEADAMSELVSFGADKQRFRIVAEEWRAKAASTELTPVAAPPPPHRRDLFSLSKLKVGFRPR
jgi:hypothetical protein